MEIHKVDIETMHVRGLEHRGAYQTIGNSFSRLHEYEDKLGVKNAPLVAIYYDDPHNVPEESLRSLAGVVTQGATDGAMEPLRDVEIPGGSYAMTSFVGHYSKLGKAWEDFYGAIFGSGLKTKADLCFERYVTTMEDTEPDDLITELYAPLA